MSDSLINLDRINDFLKYDAPWSDSHGGQGDFLGMGIVYYALTYATQARVAVCLGSGGGFVPRLMRQAQRDLGIAGESRTILVDGNCADAGWGTPNWLEPHSFFRTHFSDVELVIERTSAAALNWFMPQNLTIDYLHIDADHSFEGCMADFKNYSAFLTEGSLVTFHDTNYPQSGVKHIVNYVRTLGDCDVVDFVEHGAGTAILRVGKDLSTRNTLQTTRGSTEPAVLVTRKRATDPVSPGALDWRYLEAESYMSRHILAAHYLRDCATVIEIGSSKTPIHEYLTGHHASVVVIDPLAREKELTELNGEPCQILHLQACFQDLNWEILRPGDYGLLLLGMELIGMSVEDYRQLFSLINQSHTTVIEFPPSFGPSSEQYQTIIKNTRMRERLVINLDLSESAVGDMTGSWPPRYDRKIHVLEPR